MIRFKNIRFDHGVKFLAKNSDWFTEVEGFEIWLDEFDHVWIKKGKHAKLVSGVAYDAETYPEDTPQSPRELEAATKPNAKPKTAA